MSVGKVTVPRFTAGQVVATPGALGLLEKHSVIPATLLQRHVRGDWGDVGKNDAQVNEDGLKEGSMILSSYPLGSEGDKVWIISDASENPLRRDVTTLLCPSEY